MTRVVCQNHDNGVIRFFFVRHGQTDHNVQKILQGHLDIDLNDKGREQAILVGNAFSKIDLDAIISSDLIRCQNTASEITKRQPKDVKVTLTKNFRESNMGEVEGMYLKDALAKYGPNFRALGEGPVNFKQRVMSEWKNALKQHANDKNVLVCTHGGVLRMFFNTLYEQDHYQLNKDMTHEDLKTPFNTSVAIVDVCRHDPSKGTIQMFGNTDHLGAHYEVKDQLLR